MHQGDVTQVTYANAIGPDLDASEDGELSAVSRFTDGGQGCFLIGPLLASLSRPHCSRFPPAPSINLSMPLGRYAPRRASNGRFSRCVTQPHA